MPQLQRDPAPRNSSAEGLAAHCALRYPPCIALGEPLNRKRAGRIRPGSGASRILGPRFLVHLDEREGNDLAIR